MAVEQAVLLVLDDVVQRIPYDFAHNIDGESTHQDTNLHTTFRVGVLDS